mmetsp:Transcript_49398/g.143203  ORF Transcript_49398/g.143203 Transcript_49398/m.143203 type:complete len:277 (-) Transcript_49398:495-1325(-)
MLAQYSRLSTQCRTCATYQRPRVKRRWAGGTRRTCHSERRLRRPCRGCSADAGSSGLCPATLKQDIRYWSSNWLHCLAAPSHQRRFRWRKARKPTCSLRTLALTRCAPSLTRLNLWTAPRKFLTTANALCRTRTSCSSQTAPSTERKTPHKKSPRLMLLAGASSLSRSDSLLFSASSGGQFHRLLGPFCLASFGCMALLGLTSCRLETSKSVSVRVRLRESMSSSRRWNLSSAAARRRSRASRCRSWSRRSCCDIFEETQSLVRLRIESPTMFSFT